MNNTQHGGYAATGRTDGGLLHKINAALASLESTPLDSRDEYWAAAVGGVRFAGDLLAQGRRAKAGKVLADACAPIPRGDRSKVGYTLVHMGEAWRVVGVGTQRGGNTFCHLANLYRKQKDGRTPIQINDWVDSAVLASAKAPQ